MPLDNIPPVLSAEASAKSAAAPVAMMKRILIDVLEMSVMFWWCGLSFDNAIDGTGDWNAVKKNE